MKLSLPVKLYVGFIILIGAVVLIVSVLKSSFYTNEAIWAGMLFFLLLGAIAESLPVRIKRDNLLSISSTVSIASILLFGGNFATIIRFLGAILAVRKGQTHYTHLVNTEIYKTLFNGSVRGITVFLAGLTYQYLSTLLPRLSFVNFNMAGLLGLVIVYFTVDLVLFSFLFALLSKTRLWDEIAIKLWPTAYLILLAPVGVFMAGIYNWQGILPIILFVGPFLFVRHAFEQNIQLSQTSDEINTLYAALTKIAAAQGNIKTLSKLIAEIVVKDFHAYECAVLFLSDDRLWITRKAYCGPVDSDDEISISADVVGLITTAIRAKESIYVSDVRKDPRYFAGVDETLSEFVVPLLVHGEILGVINMESPKLNDFNERTRHLVMVFAENAGLAIQNAKLVTSLEQNIADLKESQEQMNFFIKHTAEGIYRIDYDPPVPTELPFDEQFRLSVQRGKIGECNDAFARMYGYSSREAILGRPYIEFYGEDGYETNLEVNLQFYRDGNRIDDKETEEYNAAGEKVHILNNVIGIIRDGYTVSTWGTQRDITPLKKALAELGHLNQRLEQRVEERTAELQAANKELETFSYSVSHDLRAPLRAIRGFSEILLRDFSDPLNPMGRNVLNKVSIAANEMSDKIDGLLRFSRLSRSELRWQPINLSEMVNEILVTLRAGDPSRTVTSEVIPNLSAQGDPVLIRDVLENLLGNAWKYSSKNPQAHIEFGMEEQDKGQVYFVRDNGVGFNMQYADKLFGAFQRLHGNEEFEGHGIGLATVHRILHRHHGEIWAKAEEGKGATFCFTLGKPD